MADDYCAGGSPGETITLELMIFDVGDRAFDSNVLLDKFRWLPSSTVVGTGGAP